MSQISTRLQQAGKPGPGLGAHESEIREQRPSRSKGRALSSALGAHAITPDLVLIGWTAVHAMTVKRLATAQEPGMGERS